MIYEDSEGNAADETVEENMRRYESRYDIKRSYVKHRTPWKYVNNIMLINL